MADENEWFGGKSAGFLKINKYNCTVTFVEGGRQVRRRTVKNFIYEKYTSKKEAIRQAKEWQERISLEKGLTKNRIRIVYPENEDIYLEVKLQGDKFMKCDVEDIEIVENSIWTAWKGQGKKCWYARRRISDRRNQGYAMFHSLLCPDYTQVDHINRDGLDNRRDNLREGREHNPKNKGIQVNNKSGVSGVYYEGRPKPRWCVQIGGKGQRRKKSFSTILYGEERAKELAIQARKEWEQELNYY